VLVTIRREVERVYLRKPKMAGDARGEPKERESPAFVRSEMAENRDTDLKHGDRRPRGAGRIEHRAIIIDEDYPGLIHGGGVADACGS
jgi:hypothetical protein